MNQGEEAEADLIYDYTSTSPDDNIPMDAKCIRVLCSVTEIPLQAFANFSDLNEICFENIGNGGHACENQSLQRIGAGAFLNCKSLSRIAIPNTVGLIEMGAFQGCTSLELVQLPLELTELAEEVFLCCQSLTTIQLPESLTKIGPAVWKGCSQLKEVHLSSGLNEIPYAAFELCVSLQTIAIPPSCKTIASYAFCDCNILRQVHLAEGLRKIDANAFRRYKSLSSIKFPVTVLRIGRCAFAECSALETVEFANGNLQVLNGLAFAECRKLLHLNLPTSIHTFYPNTFAGCSLLHSLSRRSVANLMGASLRTRFDELSVHKLCYLQVHRPLGESLEAIQRLTEDSFVPSRHLDFCGMSPFHILAASSRPDPLLFEALLSKYPLSLWNHRDKYRKTALSYLLGNLALESGAAIEHVWNSVLQARIANLGWHEWRTKLQDRIHATCMAPVSERAQLFDETIQTFRLLEQKEHLSNLELSIWKMTISRTTFDATTNHMESNGLTRERCRISCGAEIVIPIVLSYVEKPAMDVFGL